MVKALLLHRPAGRHREAPQPPAPRKRARLLRGGRRAPARHFGYAELNSLLGIIGYAFRSWTESRSPTPNLTTPLAAPSHVHMNNVLGCANIQELVFFKGNFGLKPIIFDPERRLTVVVGQAVIVSSQSPASAQQTPWVKWIECLSSQLRRTLLFIEVTLVSLPRAQTSMSVSSPPCLTRRRSHSRGARSLLLSGAVHRPQRHVCPDQDVHRPLR